MGQAPSATRPIAKEQEGVADVSVVNGEQSLGNIDGEDNICGSGGCLPLLSCFHPFNLNTSEGRHHRTAFELSDQYQCLTVVADDEDDELPPDDLALTDVEDEEDDIINEHEDDTTREEEIQELTDEEGVAPPDITDGEEAPEENPTATPPSIPQDVLSRIVAVDCGMVLVPGKSTSSISTNNRRSSTQLRRVSIVDGYGSPLLNALVRIEDDVDNYYSSAARYISSLLPRPPRINGCGDNLDLGVSAEQIKKESYQLLKGKIVVGHQVEGDLAILGLGQNSASNKEGSRNIREFEVRDTASYKPFTNKRTSFHGGRKIMARKLSDLVRERLDKEIQPQGQFHECEEDAVAALELYKSVYHEWEASCEESTKKEENTEDIDTTTQQETEQKNKRLNQKSSSSDSAKHQDYKAPQNKKKQKGKKEFPCNKNAKKKEKRREKARVQKKKTQQSTQKPHFTLYTAIPGCTYLCEILFYPFKLTLRIINDLICLAKAIPPSAIRLAQGNPSEKVKVRLPKPFDSKKKKKKKKLCKQKSLFFNLKWKWLDNVFVLCHCLLEVLTILTLLQHWYSAPYEEKKFMSAMQRVNGAFLLCIIGLNLCRRNNRFSRHDNVSKALYALLAQYRMVCFLIGMSAFVISCMDESNLQQHAMQESDVAPDLEYNAQHHSFFAVEEDLYSDVDSQTSLAEKPHPLSQLDHNTSGFVLNVIENERAWAITTFHLRHASLAFEQVKDLSHIWVERTGTALHLNQYFDVSAFLGSIAPLVQDGFESVKYLQDIIMEEASSLAEIIMPFIEAGSTRLRILVEIVVAEATFFIQSMSPLIEDLSARVQYPGQIVAKHAAFCAESIDLSKLQHLGETALARAFHNKESLPIALDLMMCCWFARRASKKI